MPPTSNSEASPLLDNDESIIVRRNAQKWDRRLVCQMGAAMYSFAMLGLFNSSTGAVLPMFLRHFDITDLHVSFIFLTGSVGYVSAAQASDAIHSRFGQRGIGIFGSSMLIIAHGLIAMHGSFGAILVAFTIQGIGAGLLDGSWSSWAGSMEKGNTMSGLLHGSYSLGAAMGTIFLHTNYNARESVVDMVQHTRTYWQTSRLRHPN